MKWISKDPPIYVWKDDLWYNEKDKLVYSANITKQAWIADTAIPFPKKTRVMTTKENR
mgnify:CR=1 FL=1